MQLQIEVHGKSYFPYITTSLSKEETAARANRIYNLLSYSNAELGRRVGVAGGTIATWRTRGCPDYGLKKLETILEGHSYEDYKSYLDQVETIESLLIKEAFKEGLEQGFKEGLEKGFKEGLEKGFTEGKESMPVQLISAAEWETEAVEQSQVDRLVTTINKWLRENTYADKMHTHCEADIPIDFWPTEEDMKQLYQIAVEQGWLAIAACYGENSIYLTLMFKSTS